MEEYRQLQAVIKGWDNLSCIDKYTLAIQVWLITLPITLIAYRIVNCLCLLSLSLIAYGTIHVGGIAWMSIVYHHRHHLTLLLYLREVVYPTVLSGVMSWLYS